MGLVDSIKMAHNAVLEAELSPDLQGIAFGEVLRHVLAGPDQSGVKDLNEATHAAPPGEAGGLGLLASRVTTSSSALADLFDISEGSASLHVASGRIASTKSKATKEIALLVTAARQGGGVDETWTSVDHIREALQQYKKYDTNNFSAYLKATGNAFNFRGKGASAEIRLTQAGWEMATNLIQSLLSEKL
jgi:hypothetical protein